MRFARVTTLFGAIILATNGVAPAQTSLYQIQAILPLTGPSASVGHDFQVALDVYEKATNSRGGLRGRPIHFVVSDDQSDPRVSVQIASRLFADHPPVVLGPASVGTCAAVSSLTDNGPVVYCLSPGLNPKKDTYVFASSVSTDYLVPAMVKYARLRGFRHLALITASDASGLAALKITQTALEDPANRGLQTVADERFAPTDVSVAAQVARIKAAQPDAIFVWAVGGALATVLRGLRDGGVTNAIVLTNNANESPELLKRYADFMPKELLFPGLSYQAGNRLPRGPLKEATTQFVDAYRAQGVEPTTLSAYAWDPARIVVEALRMLGPDTSASTLRAYLAGLHGFVGLNGTYDFRIGDQHGLTDTATLMVGWNQRTGGFDPVSTAGGGLIP
jgi:branched-chain amino acid transport system substrate-binding protein